MSRYSGPGPHPDVKAQKRREAEERNARTLQERTAWFRRQRQRIRAALAKELP